MFSLEQIYEVIDPYIDRKTITPDADLNTDQGIDGDDFDELIIAYQKKFGVNMETYLWYFHAADEGSINSIGTWFSKPPNERVQHIPVTPAMLLEFANKGRWDIKYPPHTLPKYRWDVLASWIIILVTLALMILNCTN